MSHVKIMNMRCCAIFILLVLVLSFASCGKSEKPATTEVTQKTFASPDDAAKSLVEAAKAEKPRRIDRDLRSGDSRTSSSPAMQPRTKYRLNTSPPPTQP